MRFLLIVLAVSLTAFCAVYFWPTAQRTDAMTTPTAASAALPALPARDAFSCDVASITDGDTLRCRDGTRVRLHAISARERDDSCSPGHPCPTRSAREATDQLTRLAGGRRLACQRTGTSYNRVNAICWNEAGVEINCALVGSGVALRWERFHRETPICRTG